MKGFGNSVLYSQLLGVEVGVEPLQLLHGEGNQLQHRGLNGLLNPKLLLIKFVDRKVLGIQID